MSRKDSEVLEWKAVKLNTKVRNGVRIMARLLAEDERNARLKGSGLPSDWRSRIIR